MYLYASITFLYPTPLEHSHGCWMFTFLGIPPSFEEIHKRKRKMLTGFLEHDLQKRFLKTKWTTTKSNIK